MKPSLLSATIIFFLLPGAFLHSVPAEAASAPAYPPHVVPNTELRVLPRTRPDRLYQLQIALPADFKKHPEMKYPVVFVADGYWAFTTVAAICANLTYGKNVPPMLVVGLGYAGDNPDYDKLRGTDLLPVISTHPRIGACSNRKLDSPFSEPAAAKRTLVSMNTFTSACAYRRSRTLPSQPRPVRSSVRWSPSEYHAWGPLRLAEGKGRLRTLLR